MVDLKKVFTKAVYPLDYEIIIIIAHVLKGMSVTISNVNRPNLLLIRTNKTNRQANLMHVQNMLHS